MSFDLIMLVPTSIASAPSAFILAASAEEFIPDSLTTIMFLGINFLNPENLLKSIENVAKSLLLMPIISAPAETAFLISSLLWHSARHWILSSFAICK